MRIKRMLWLLSLVLVASLAWSQGGPDRICEINLVSAKPGMNSQLEDGRKKHNQFHAAEKDKNPVTVWSIATGPATGQYLMGTCGLQWKDLDGRDAFNAKDAADIQRTMAPSVARTETSYYMLRPDLSLSPESPTPAKMISVTHFMVKPEGTMVFTNAVKRIGEAITKSKYPTPPSRWYQLVNGGEGPHFVLVSDRASWADMQGPQKTMAAMLSEVYGADDKTLQTLRESVSSTLSELLEYRADLSYTPAK